MFGRLGHRTQHHPTRSGSRLRLVALSGLAVIPLVAGSLVVAQADPTGDPRANAPGRNCSCTHVLFKDYFNADTGAWTFLNRAGRIKGGRLVINGDYVQDPAPHRDGFAFTHVGDKGWRNYVLSATFDSTNPGGYPAHVHTNALMVRVADTGVAGHGTLYRIQVWSPGGEDPTGHGHDMSKGLVSLERLNNGKTTILKLRYRSNVVVGSNQATVEAHGKVITVRVNGVQVLRFKDPKPLRYGGVGVCQVWETNGSYDNVMVVERIR